MHMFFKGLKDHRGVIKYRRQQKLNLLHTVETDETLPNSFSEVTFTLVSKQHEDPTKKENDRPISLMNTDTKLLSKIFAN